MSSCRYPEIDDANMLDGNIISYAITDSLNKNLASKYLSPVTPSMKNTPIIIAAHGYSATTFEWDELRAYADSAKTFYVSQVLLGGHGRTYQAFKNADWQDWQVSIMDEYRKLDSLGFKQIYLAGSSTGAPLIINLVKNGFFDDKSKPKGIFLIDPIVVSSNKTLTMVGLLGPLLGYTTTELANGEQGHWYVYRPQHSLKQLMELINLTRRDLERGLILPQGTYMKVYKSKIDDVADPISAYLIYKGIQTSNDGLIDVEMVDSKLHVFTRLKGRDDVTDIDKANQKIVFNKIEDRIKN